MADDLKSLIADGRLKVGTTLIHRGRSHGVRSATAVVTAAGLLANKQTFVTPSAAAKSITGKPVDGWIFWRLPNGEPLATLRLSDPTKGPI